MAGDPFGLARVGSIAVPNQAGYAQSNGEFLYRLCTGERDIDIYRMI